MTVEDDKLQFQLASNSEFEELFACVKQGILEHVDNVFGWDDEFQRSRLLNDYHPSWFHWIYHEKERIGLVCFKPYDNTYHILIIYPQYQGKMLGKEVMSLIHNKALREQRNQVILSSFRSNARAISFYQRLGYQIIDDSDEDFVGMAFYLDDNLLP
ncbi:MAG: GNAT family N-acetyltransferase [Vibrio toranzoniae]|uniref:GNAT family N-acetyltransferase n=1 Tax=Vibrio toranzoniae TaxID=1194427 RepID=UPI001376D6A7|nr:GNAT family N-acetyltransferase [Vibrio toranzoniae]